MSNQLYTRQDLESLIKELMDISSITPMIKRQINDYVLKDNMTFKEIARCLVWYTEVFGGVLQPVYGIGIVPSIKEQSAKYFKQLELDQQAQAEEAKRVVEYQDNNIIFNISSLKHNKRKPKQLDLTEINIQGDENNER